MASSPACLLGLPVIAPGNAQLSASLAKSWEGVVGRQGRQGGHLRNIKQEICQSKHVCSSRSPSPSLCAFGQTASLLRAVSFARLVLCVASCQFAQTFLALNILFLVLCFFFSYPFSAHFIVETCTCPLSFVQTLSQAAISSGSVLYICFATAFIYL